MGGASCSLMRGAVRLARVTSWGEASEHRACATWVNMLLCARWEATDHFLSLRTFFLGGTKVPANTMIHRAEALACVSLGRPEMAQEYPLRGYRVTESDELVQLVTDRRQYHRVVSGKPHNAQTSTHWPCFIVHKLWRVSRLDVQTAPEGGSEGAAEFASRSRMSVTIR